MTPAAITHPRRHPVRGAAAAATLLLAALAMLALPDVAAAENVSRLDRKLRDDLPAAAESARLPVIVTVRPGAKTGLLRALGAVGVSPEADFTDLEAFAVRVPPGLLRVLTDDPDVLAISSDAPVVSTGIAGSVSGTAANSAYSLKATLGLDGTTYTGAGVTVAVIDSGIYKTADFDKRITLTKDFTAGGKTVSPLDPYGHGTHVGGIIGSSKNDVPALAPAVKLISLRALDASGSGTTSAVISAIQWAVANKAAYDIDILNLSLGHPVYEPAATDPLVQAVEAAVRAGIVVVVSAGNVGIEAGKTVPGYGGISSPGNAPSAITVGAVKTLETTRRTDDLVSDYSSRGPTWYDAYAKPDLVAPGHHVLSVANTTSTLFKNNPYLTVKAATRTYMYLNGTSMAAPTVTGTVALMIEASKKKFSGVKPSPNAIKAMLMHSAFPMADATGQRYDVFTQGAGALNGAGAVELAESIDPRKALNTLWMVSTPVTASLVDGQTISWGQNIVWGDNLVWGDALATYKLPWASNIVWGDNLVWGDSLRTLTSATNIVWGDNLVWGDNIVWGDAYNIVWGDATNIVWGDVSLSDAFSQSLSVLTLPY